MDTTNALLGRIMYTFSLQLVAAGKDGVLYQGQRLETFLPIEEWQQFSPQAPSLFPCTFCGTDVIAFQASQAKGTIATCRCTMLHFLLAPPFHSQDQWTSWQADYVREISDPVPIAALREGSLIGRLGSVGSDWFSRKLGLPEGLQFETGGVIRAGQASLSLHGNSVLTTIDEGDPLNNQKIAELTRIIYARDGAVPPERLVIAGRDSDYVWPPGTDLQKVARVAFRCAECNAWVKQAPLEDWPEYDRVLGCLCHVIAFRKGIAQPQNYREWRELLLQAKTERTWHEAAQTLNSRKN